MSSRRRPPAGFSLIETMITAAILGVVSTALVSTMSFSTSQAGRARMTSIASTDAQAQMDRIIGIGELVRRAGLPAARICELYKAPGGPLDVTGGGVAVGTCPLFSVTGIKIPGTGLTRAVTLTDLPLGDLPGLLVSIEVTGPQLTNPLIIRTHITQ